MARCFSSSLVIRVENRDGLWCSGFHRSSLPFHGLMNVQAHFRARTSHRPGSSPRPSRPGSSPRPSRPAALRLLFRSPAVSNLGFACFVVYRMEGLMARVLVVAKLSAAAAAESFATTKTLAMHENKQTNNRRRALLLSSCCFPPPGKICVLSHQSGHSLEHCPKVLF